MKEKDQKTTEKTITVKMLLCLVYLIIISILFVSAYKIFQEKYAAKPWEEVESVDNYAYITASKMSGKFAYYEDEKIGFYFVIEEEDTGIWHTYIVAIHDDDYEEYKDLIDYTYKRTEKEVAPIKLYGYPEIIRDDLKKLAIKNIDSFVPSENEVRITEDNFETYLTNSYLNAAKDKEDYFSILLFIILILLFVMIFLFIYTIFEKEKYKKTYNVKELSKELADAIMKKKREQKKEE